MDDHSEASTSAQGPTANDRPRPLVLQQPGKSDILAQSDDKLRKLALPKLLLASLVPGQQHGGSRPSLRQTCRWCGNAEKPATRELKAHHTTGGESRMCTKRAPDESIGEDQANERRKFQALVANAVEQADKKSKHGAVVAEADAQQTVEEAGGVLVTTMADVERSLVDLICVANISAATLDKPEFWRFVENVNAVSRACLVEPSKTSEPSAKKIKLMTSWTFRRKALPGRDIALLDEVVPQLKQRGDLEGASLAADGMFEGGMKMYNFFYNSLLAFAGFQYSLSIINDC